jgi:hypothetical protein
MDNNRRWVSWLVAVVVVAAAYLLFDWLYVRYELQRPMLIFTTMLAAYLVGRK